MKITYCVVGNFYCSSSMRNIIVAAFLVLVPVYSEDAQSCSDYDWQCRDGSCIKFDGKCDGIIDCPDGSDETHALCRNTICPDYLFRCAYGACVDGTAPCNGYKDCADNSDELAPKCRNETRIVRGQFKCDNSQLISVTELCDGLTDCSDGSDETIQSCADNICLSYLFQCAYGACVDQGSDCNENQDCADNSDESDELCNRTSTNIVTPSITRNNSSSDLGLCVLPPNPQNGRFEVGGDPFASPGKQYKSLVLKLTCETGYEVDGNDVAVCYNGIGFEDLPKCSRYCVLHPHRSVEYSCITKLGDSQTTRPCNRREFPGTKVVPKCREPNYYGTLSNMVCKDDGTWSSNIKHCTADCGKVTPDGKQYVIDGKRAKHGELPWHAGIYEKKNLLYKQICGGSLVSTTTVITAAHCFWHDIEGQLPAELFAVGLGKIYRPWNESHDVGSQHSNVSEIHMPPEFQGASTNYQYDIAILVLETEIVYQTFIRPVCIDFDTNLNSKHLRDGNLGKIAGWGLNAANGKAAPVLQVVELPFVPYKKCFDESPEEFRPYINGDKFCAGFKNGTTLCEGDSGGGLAFPEQEKDFTKYYLRGIVSTAPRNDKLKCDPNTRITFTSIAKHESFIKDYANLND